MNQPAAHLDHLEARVAQRMAALLHEGARDPGHAVSERLRVAREQALARAREVRQLQTAPAVHVTAGGAGVLGGFFGAWVSKLAMALPAVALVAGLLVIDQQHDQAQMESSVDTDLALLTDDVPPDAYSDAGFAEYLRSNGLTVTR